MTLLAAITPGDTLGVCAPSACFDRKSFDQGILLIKSLGYHVRIPDGVFDRKRYLAGPDIQRANIINDLFADSDIHGIICARGGFGSMRLLEYLDWDVIEKNPKPFIGFSDQTAVLLSIIDRVKIPVIHGPTLVSLATAEPETIDSLVQVLKFPSHIKEVCFEKAVISGQSQGILKGGNMSTICHLIGTPFSPDFKNCILFLEEIKEPAYKIDRMLSQMKIAGCFNGIKAVVTGSFHNCEQPEYIEEIFVDIFHKHKIPILSGLNCGHGLINLSLPMGLDVLVDSKQLTMSWVS